MLSAPLFLKIYSNRCAYASRCNLLLFSAFLQNFKWKSVSTCYKTWQKCVLSLKLHSELNKHFLLWFLMLFYVKKRRRCGLVSKKTTGASGFLALRVEGRKTELYIPAT